METKEAQLCITGEDMEDCESIVSNARVSVCDVEASIRELTGIKKELIKRQTALMPLIEKVKPKLARLDELKRIRDLLIRFQLVNGVHEKLEALNNVKSSKESEEDGQIVESVDLYKLLIIEWKSLEKVHDDNRYKRYVKEIIAHWNRKLLGKVEQTFEALLKDINWPILTSSPINDMNYAQPDVMRRFQQYFKFLLLLDLKPLFFGKECYQNIEAINLFDTSYVCLPLEVMISPLRKRFSYHFMSNLKTNQLSKPEWYFTQVMNWIKSHEDFLFKNVEPLIKESDEELLPAHIQFICALMNQVAQKMESDLPKLLNDDRLFSHAFDETLQFERELIETYQRWSNFFRENCNLLSLFAVEPYFKRLILIEKRRSMEYLESIISTETAWNHIISPLDDEDLEDNEDFKVPEVADNFILMLQTMTERLRYLAKIGHRYVFIDLEIKMLADFHLRLAQLYRSLEDQVLNNWPLPSKFFSILNALNFVDVVLKNWKSHEIFGEMSEFTTKDSILDETTETYEHLINEMLKRTIASIETSLNEGFIKYSNLGWHILSPSDDNHQYTSYRLLYAMAKSLELLRRRLSKNLLEEIIITLAKNLNKRILDKLIFKNHFNKEGSKQINQDLSAHLCSVFRAYINKPEDYFNEILDACKILALSRENHLKLKKSLQNDLNDKGELSKVSINSLSPEQVLDILIRKRFA
ncbi:RAD50 interactor 1 [Brevipalpus obovatus]|uniref:RAD50 interactor 1 n=1 Tax=Brevipalpus obovatus TaxID=246614 RepID=UPI003D9E2CF8